MLPRALDRYIVTAVLPYIALGLSILTIILLIQQTNRFADILGSSGAGLSLTLDVALNLLPNLLIFTLPMATLVGVATGFSRMGHDSELIAMRAAGVGTYRIILPTFILGAIISLLTFYVGFIVAPASARNLREIGLRVAFYRMESPVEPKSFYTGMPGKVVYVREGDKETGQWEKIFIYWQEADGRVRLVTAQKGRLDFSGEQTELVLEDAIITTLPAGGIKAIQSGEHVTIEQAASMRVKDDHLNTGRSALAKRIREREPELDEMGWAQLSEKTRSGPEDSKQREAVLALNKRLALSFSPLVFAFFGSCLGLRSMRGGRSQAVIASLISMLLYYLISIAGEQLGRAGIIPPTIGPWIGVYASTICAYLLLRTRYWNFTFTFIQGSGRAKSPLKERREALPKGQVPMLLGLLDRKLLKALVWNFLITFLSLIAVFVIFTLFDLLKFIALNRTSASIVAKYFLFLLPFTSIAVIPVCTLLSVLITFTLMVRRSESIAWWASGQSIFRLILPCILFAVILGAGVWFTQEQLMPTANRRQNLLRGIIRNGTSQIESQQGKKWISSADSRRIYTFDSTMEEGRIENLIVFKLNSEMIKLEQILSTDQALIDPTSMLITGEADEIELSGKSVLHTRSSSLIMPAEEFRAIRDGFNKPSEFDSRALSAYIKALKARGLGTDMLSVALERRKVEPLYPLIMVFVAAPLAMVLGRRSSMLALCIAIGMGLAFLGITTGLQQIGASGYLSPVIATWAPAFLFLALGIYLLSRSHT